MTASRKNLVYLKGWALYHWVNAYGSARPPRGHVLIVHGLGEHGGRYAELALYLNEFGFDVWAPDLPAHGLTQVTSRLHSLQDLIDQISEWKDQWLGENRRFEQPWFLVGHSMGALLSLGWILRGKRSETERPFAERAFLSAPPLGLKLIVPNWKKQISKKLRDLTPDLKIPNGIVPDFLTQDSAVVGLFREDPLTHSFATPRYFESQLEVADMVLSRPRDIEIPVFLAAGGADPVVDSQVVETYYRSLSTHKKWMGIPMGRHEILNEINREGLYQAVASWFL